MGDHLTLFHTGFSVISDPDVHFGRKNADFGQGFYLSDDEEFSKRWARARRDLTTYLNRYELDLNCLLVKRFLRNGDWFDYIFSNRAGKKDSFAEFDVIIGPIANDTLFDTWGILTSGLISRETALEILTLGPEFKQIVLKTEKAANSLDFIDAKALSADEIASYRETVRREEEIFQEAFALKAETLFP